MNFDIPLNDRNLGTSIAHETKSADSEIFSKNLKPLLTEKRGRPKSKPTCNDFECEICNRFFASSTGLQSHKASVHENKTYVCDICNKEFKWHSSLSTHKRKKRCRGILVFQQKSLMAKNQMVKKPEFTMS